MDQWYEYLEAFPKDPDAKIYLKTIQTVENIIKEDLAEFEFDYLSSTVFHTPINLFDRISISRNIDSWSNVIEKSFKLISDIVQKYGDYVHRYVDEMVELCQQSYVPTTRRHALNCLTSVVKHSQPLPNVMKLISELQTGDTCRVPLALLVGAICEHHPETVNDNIELIWRTYLQLLEGRANSETIPASILQGVNSVLKHFGLNLPTAEINGFYSTMIKLFYSNGKCEDVCLTMLTNYANLFPERLLSDEKTRRFLWKKLPKSTAAILSVYRNIKNFKEYQTIIQSEVSHRLQSSYYIEKFTSLRVISDVDVAKMYVDVQVYVFELGSDNTSPEVLEAIQFCIESDLPDCDRLLQICIDKYEVIPNNKRRSVFVHSLLKASDGIRNTTIKYLISETCKPNQPEQATSVFYTIWSDIFDSNHGTDNIVLERSRTVYEEFMMYFIDVLECIDDDDDNLPSHITSLIDLSSHIIILYDKENAWYSHALKTRVSIDAIKTLAYACVNKTVVDLNKLLDITRSPDEASLCACCLASITAPCEAGITLPTLLESLSVIFSNSRVSEEELVVAVGKMKGVLVGNGGEVDADVKNEIIHKISKIENRKNLIGKEGRILRREVAMFLAKFHNVSQVYNPLNVRDNLLLTSAEDLTLNIFNTCDASVCKINMKPVLHSALVEEEPTVLKCLLALVCNSAPPPAASLAASLSLSLCECHVRGDDVIAPLNTLHCGAVTDLVEYLSNRKSPGLRRMLCDGIEDLLSVAGIESEAPLQVVSEHVKIMLLSQRVETVRAGLDLAKTLLTVLNQSQNHTMMKQILPDIITLSSKTSESESFSILHEALNTLMEELELFDPNVIEDIIKQVFVNLTSKILTVNCQNEHRNVKIFKKITRLFVGVVKDIYERQEVEDRKRVFEFAKSGLLENRLYILAVIKEVFAFDSEQCKEGLFGDDYRVQEELISYDLRDKDYFAFESVFEFYSQYLSLLLEHRYQDTILQIRAIMHLMSPEHLIKIQKTFKKFMVVLKNELTTLPQNLLANIEEFINNLDLETVTRELKDGDISIDSETSVSAVKIILESTDFDYTTTFISTVTTIKEWTKIVLRLFVNGQVQDDLKYKKTFLTDVIRLSLSFLTVGEIKRLIYPSSIAGLPSDKIGLDFCRYFIAAFYKTLLNKLFVLLDSDMGECTILLNDVVKHCIKLNFPEEDCSLIVELVDKLWPTYSQHSSNNQKYDLLLSLNTFPKRLNPESNPVRWAVDTIKDGGEFSEMLLGVLPEGGNYTECYARITSAMPLQLSEMSTKWRATFTAMLDCLSNTGDLVLLDIVAKFIAAEPTRGWWWELLPQLSSRLCARNDDVLKHLYTTCVPLLHVVLRYAPTQSTDSFFAAHLPLILSAMSRTVGHSAGERYRLALIDCARAVDVVTVAFEKPSKTIDWQTGREVCKRCVTIRDRLHKVPGDIANEERRVLHGACYSATSLALLRWRRFDSRVVKFVCSELAFTGLVGEVELPVTPFPLRNRRHVTCLPDDVIASSSMTSHSTVRTKPFLRTLTENPLAYDLNEESQAESEIQEITLADSPLNNHACAAAMTAVICQLSKLPSAEWLDAIVEALRGDMWRGDKWLVCQIICNLKDILAPHAIKLRPALLTVVSEADGHILNAVHVYILETLTHWPTQDDDTSESVTLPFSNLINTCLENISKTYVFIHLDNIVGKVLTSYCQNVSLSDEVAEKLVSTLTANPDKNHVKILTRLLQNNIKIPGLLPRLLQTLQTTKWSNLDSKLFGYLRPNDTELRKFRSMLDVVRRGSVGDYVKILYYAQMRFDRCCDEHHFRMIFEQVPKIVGDIKKKCINIISTYVSKNTNDSVKDMFESIEICELLLSDYVTDTLQVVKNGHEQMSKSVKNRALSVISDLCQNVSVKIREAAFGAVNVMLKDTLKKDSFEQPSKRPRLSTSKVFQLSDDTEVSRVVKLVCLGATDKNKGIATMCRMTLAGFLSEDLYLRFIECLHLILHLPSKLHKRRQTDICITVSAILEMLFQRVRQTDEWARKVVELPKPKLRQDAESKLMTMSRTYQGTFTKTLRTNKQAVTKQKETVIEETSISMETILSSILNFAESNTKAALNLISTVALSLLPANFEYNNYWQQIVFEGLNEINELTNLMLYVCRAGDVSENVLPQVSKLRELTSSSEGYELVNLLYEELNIKYHDHTQFVLGNINTSMEIDIKSEETETFSLERLTSAFKRLSNWNELTLQEQNETKRELPPLWTGKDEFVNVLDSYAGTDDWFSFLSKSCFDQGQTNNMNLMNLMNNWPRRPFVLSALSEAMEWQSNTQFDIDSSQYKYFDIPAEECLVEWAARLMIRSIYLQRQGSEEVSLSRSHELKWCERASEMAIPKIVSQCVDRNSNDDWDRSEVLPWLYQKVLCQLCDDKLDVARRALEKLESTVPIYIDDTSPLVVTNINTLKIKLMDKCGELSQQKLSNIVENTNGLYNNDPDKLISTKSKKDLKKFYETALVYSGKCNSKATNESTVQKITQTAAIVNKMSDLNLSETKHLDFVLSLLDQLVDGLTDELGRQVLSALTPLTSLFTPFSSPLLLSPLFAPYLPHFPHLRSKLLETACTNRASLCLQLVCDARFSLRQFCEQLRKAVDDDDEIKWRSTFDRMKRRIFENPYAGTDYQLLNKYKKKLYDLQYLFATAKPTVSSTLTSILTALYNTASTSLRLSQLCPRLTADVCDDDGLREMMGGKRILRFDEQVQVYTDSIRQPCAFRVRFLDGTSRSYIHKSGEEMRRDAAAQIVARSVVEGWRGYHVTVLDEDSALIERLENHQRLGSFIPGTTQILENMHLDPRPANNLLMLSPPASLVNHHVRLAKKLPANALRSAIEKHSSCVEDFIMKKRNFTNSLASMTVLSWILGLGDRHLNNILYSLPSGDIIPVDWGSSAGGAGVEPAPARITAQMLAVGAGIESRLQRLLSKVRESPNRELIQATVNVSYSWLEPQFKDKLNYTYGILSGRYLSHQITTDVFEKSSIPHKDKYVEVLRKLFKDYPQKEEYTVEEQVTCLLRHCTSHEVLSIIRKEWEPWV